MSLKYQERQKKQLINEDNHSLIYSIGEYRKSVTNLAIGCIRKQSVRNISEWKSSKKGNIEYSNNNNKNSNHSHQQQLRPMSTQFNSIPTKKKRFNYGITLQSQSQSILLSNNNYQPYSQQNKINSTSASKHNSHHHQNTKSYSVLRKPQENNYLTQPFTILDDQKIEGNRYLFGEQNDRTRIDRESQKSICINKSNSKMIQLYSNKPHNNNNKQKSPLRSQFINNNNPLAKHPSSFQSITINKQFISLQKPSQTTQKLFKQKQPLKQTITSKLQLQSITYPKAEIYTSRSDYHIQKLTNKLDSYIKKHIKNY